jgi:hypothetical protein
MIMHCLSYICIVRRIQEMYECMHTILMNDRHCYNHASNHMYSYAINGKLYGYMYELQKPIADHYMSNSCKA